MKDSMPYDCSESSNVEAFRKLPPSTQMYIRTVQNSIQEEISRKNPGLFKSTSGFRSQATNQKYGGVLESLHRLGVARDFVPVSGIFTSIPLVDENRFTLLRSPCDVKLPQKCWHVQIKV